MRAESCFILDAAEYLSVLAARYIVALALLDEPQMPRLHAHPAAPSNPPPTVAYLHHQPDAVRYAPHPSPATRDGAPERPAPPRTPPLN